MKRMSHHSILRRMAATIAMALTAAVIPSAFAASGDLDPTFGTSGITTTDFGNNPPRPAVGTATAIQPDGKIVLAGRNGVNVPAVGGNSEIALARYDANGTLDATFGTGGKVVVSVVPPPQVNLARGIAIQTDGKLVVAGMAGPNEQTANAVLIRFNSNGSLDTAFGTGGIVQLNVIAGAGNGFRAVVIQPNGKIVAVGAAGPNGLVARFNTNGSLDTTFGGGGTGWVSPLLLNGSHFFDVELDASGRINTGGFVINGAQDDFLAARYTTAGIPDTTFDFDGYSVVSAGTLNELAFSTALDSSGRLLLTGIANATNPFGTLGDGDFGTVRLNINGAPDTTFGAGGVVITSVTSLLVDEARSMVIQPDGKIVLTGLSGEATPFPLDPTNGKWTLIRYNVNGTLDTTFGVNATGVVTTPFNGDATDGDSANSAAIDANGKLVVGGTATVTKPNGQPGLNFTVARYEL